MIENVPCASPKCARDGKIWCADDRFIPFAEDEHAGAWFCRECSWQFMCGVDDALFMEDGHETARTARRTLDGRLVKS